MLRPASLLPALRQAFDAPLWSREFLPSTGACYRALRRLHGRVSHPQEDRVFQDAPYCLIIALTIERGWPNAFANNDLAPQIGMRNA